MTPRWSRANRARRAAEPGAEPQQPAGPEQAAEDPFAANDPGAGAVGDPGGAYDPGASAEHEPDTYDPGAEAAGDLGGEAPVDAGGGAEYDPGEAYDVAPEDPAAEAEPQATDPAQADSLQDLTAMAESLLAQAADLRRQTQALADELAGREGWDDEPEQPPGATTDTFPAVQPGGDDPQPAEPEPEPDPVSGMRIVAVNMAAQGRSREEAAAYLRETFGQEPDAALLDEVFAAG